jgi:hypothetical protein
MRLKSLLAIATAAMALGLAAPKSAEAFGWKRHPEPAGWGRMRTIRHWVYHPRYKHVYLTHGDTDPYAYRYMPRGYYPYYNSHYWTSASEMRARRKARLRHPPYYAAWGYPDHHYSHTEWHYRNHGGHRHHHW